MAADPRPPPDLFGIVRNAATGEGLAGYRVEAIAAGNDSAPPLARATSDLRGGFSLWLSRAGSQSGNKQADTTPIVLRVRNPFGLEVHRSAPIDRAARSRLQRIDVRIDASNQRPAGPARPDAFQRVADRHPDEAAAFRKAGVSNLSTLRDADLERVSAASGIDRTRLGAFRLEAEMGDDGMDTKSALAIVRSAGIDSRTQLAEANPRDVVNALGSNGTDAKANARAVTWTRAAGGYDASGFAQAPPASITAKAQRLTDRVARFNPTARMQSVEHMQDPAVKQRSIARARSLMTEAGVHDLATLGKFNVRGKRKFEPGFHIAQPVFDEVSNDLVKEAGRATDRLVAFGKKRYKHVEVDADAIHFVTNPITDAVILGSIVELADDGEIVIGHEVSKLTIITNEIVYGEVIRISYEGKDDVPDTPEQTTLPAPKGNPDNVPTTFKKEPNTSGPPDKGRNGGDGSDGADGTEQWGGDIVGLTPDLAIYVKSTPRGLPDIDVEGHRGGQGQDGQDGGRGGDGARGGPSKSGVLSCIHVAGPGGKGGRGGDGGRGAHGGRGGTGGSVEIITVWDNVDLVDSGREAFINMDGGPGGPGGTGGKGGAGGIGGLPGENKGIWCSGLTLIETDDGADGKDGSDGPTGERGHGGEFSVITLSDDEWDAAIDRPWIVRLEPWEGFAGEPVKVVGLNLIDDSVVRWEHITITPDSIDVAAQTLTFTVPDRAQGGQHTVRLRAIDSEGNPVVTDPVEFTVRPKLLAVAPDNGVPNKVLTLLGTGFHPDAQVDIGAVTFAAVASEEFPTTRMEVTLPDHEHIGLPEGELDVRVVNPDNERSNALKFDFSLELEIRIKAWRVTPDIWLSGGGGDGSVENPYPSRTAEGIRDMFQNGVLEGIWGPHRIHFVLDSEIDDIVLPVDIAVNWPHAQTKAEDDATLKAKDDAGNFLHFDENAINFYFVHNIEEEDGGHVFAFADKIGDLPNRPGSYVIFGDSILGNKDMARFAAHELGHIMSLVHVCDDDNPGTSRFKRECLVSDRRFLMYTGWEKVLTHAHRTDISPQEAIDARICVTPHHKPWQD